MPYVEWRGGKCRVRWFTGEIHPETGKKVYDSRSGFTDETEAYTYGLDRESDVRNDRYISRRDGSVTMGEYCRTWPDTLDVGHLRERTIESVIRLYIRPRWGETAIADIKPSSYRAWVKQLKDAPTVGERYAQEILAVFAMMMDDAVDDGLIAASPVKRKNRKRGKYKKKPREKKREMRIEAVHQLALNAAAFWGLDGYVFMLTMPFTCMRPGELYALRREFCHPQWPASDPDPERRDEALERYRGAEPMPALRVQWQYQRERGKGAPKLFPPKYESDRNLVLPPFLAELLELLDSHDDPHVFRAIGGGNLANANFSYYYWRPIADGRDATEPHERVRRGQRQTVRSRRPVPALPVTAYEGRRLYLLRHGGKEWLDEDGHSRIAVETRMGHEVAGVEGLYANVTVGMERAIMDSLQERWLRFVAQESDQLWEASPIPLPPVLLEWMKRQVKAAEVLD